MNKYELSDALKAMTHNAGCEGVDDDLLFVIANLTERERGKLVALCGRYGYTTPTNANAANGSREITIYEAQKREDARAQAEGRKPRLIATLADIHD